MNLLQKLLMMKELTFNAGEIRLLNNRAFLASDSVFKGITDFLKDYPKFIAEIYGKIKNSHMEGWGKTISEKYKLEPRKYMELMFDISNLAGWGKSTLIEFEDELIQGTFITENPLMAVKYKGKTKIPIDHIWRATGAGTGSAIFQEEMDWIETKCQALGHPHCEIHFFLRKNITSKIIRKYGYQIDIDR